MEVLVKLSRGKFSEVLADQVEANEIALGALCTSCKLAARSRAGVHGGALRARWRSYMEENLSLGFLWQIKERQLWLHRRERFRPRAFGGWCGLHDSDERGERLKSR